MATTTGNNGTAEHGSARYREVRDLASLLEGVDYIVLSAVPPERVVVTSVTADSREIRKSSLFVAVAGGRTDGHRYLDQAVDGGCSAIVVEKGRDASAALKSKNLCVVEVEDTRRAYACVAANYHGRPAERMAFIGITGTNGKTTITYLLEHVLQQYGLPVGVIGTVNYRYTTPSAKRVIPAPFTTPEPLLLQRILKEMADAGVRYVVMEASSHALLQHRLGDIRCNVAAFTNLSRDHLDYHADMEQYFAAKTLLFTEHLKKDGAAVITYGETPGDADWQKRLADFCAEAGIPSVRAGFGEGLDVRLVGADSRRDGTSITLTTPEAAITVDSPLVGKFNVENIITTIGICKAMGLDLRRVARFLAGAAGAPGRLQRVSAGNDPALPMVFVDYAHSPDALQKVLLTLKALPHRRLFCVFGCGGDRDAGKRPVMGAVAGAAGDVVIVTDDNPRSESSEAIIGQILPGLAESGCPARDAAWLERRDVSARGYLVIAVREEAIAAAVHSAGPEDVVLIAGKGHEKYQIGPAGKRFFDDCLEAQEALLSWNCTQVGNAVGGRGADLSEAALRAVSTDTRTVKAGDIFVALKGENFDGHDFLQKAADAGAGCLVMSRPDDFGRFAGYPRFLVADTLAALGALAAYRRRRIGAIGKPVVIGITGSCGKTTVKDMTAAVLARRWPDGPEVPSGRVLKTRGNLNNLIGLPLSLLPMGVRHTAAILEMGMNRPGEIDSLVRIADPDISCIVSIHAAHLEGLQTVAGVAAAKEELFAGTREDGVLIVNLDDEHIRAMAGRYTQKKITFAATDEGRALNPDLWADGIEAGRSGTVAFVLCRGDERMPVTLQAPGIHNVGNALAAASIAVAAGCTLATVAAGLGDFRPGDKRMMIMESASGLSLINDTYNANPGSMAAGLATLQQLASGGRMAILGDMLELGEASRDAHREIGRIAVERGVTYMALFGDFAESVRDGAVDAGMDPGRVRVFAEKERIAAWVEELTARGSLRKGDWILLKASRGMRFETIVEQLRVST